MTLEALNSVLLSAPQIDWDFLLDAPLKILVIIVAAVALNMIVRLFIRRLSAAVAKGTIGSTSQAANKFSGTAVQAQRAGTEPEVIRERRAQRAKTVGRMLSSVTTIIISAIAVLMILDNLNFNIAPILASAGIVGVAVAFGAQELVRDYLSGFFMVIEDQYGIGDTVDLGEAVGEVEDVGLRKTQVRDLTGTLWHVRNGEILRVGNLSQGWARAVLEIPVDYTTSMDDYRDITAKVTAALTQDPDVASAMLEPPEIAGIQSLSAEYRVIRTMVKTRPNLQWKVERAFRAELMEEFDRRGIHFPVMQETVLKTLPKTESDAAQATTKERQSADEPRSTDAEPTAAVRTSAAGPASAQKHRPEDSPSPLPSDDEIRTSADESGLDSADKEG